MLQVAIAARNSTCFEAIGAFRGGFLVSLNVSLRVHNKSTGSYKWLRWTPHEHARLPSHSIAQQSMKRMQVEALSREGDTSGDLTFVSGQVLSEICTWGIGGPAKTYVEVTTVDEMAAALRYCHEHSMSFIVVGKGSNCLFDDRGYDGCVILNRIQFLEDLGSGVYRVGSGFPFNTLGTMTSRLGFSGLEFAGGIPGTVGGAVFMNAGADGQETSDVVESVEFLNARGVKKSFERGRGELKYGYRRSPFQLSDEALAITSATFKLTSSENARSRQIMYMNRRRKSQPIASMTAGCVFRNPGGGVSAGALIETLGLKGSCVGDAEVSRIHANFLVNRGNSSCRDMRSLIALIKDHAKAEMGIDLLEEILYIPFSKNNH